MGFPLFYRIQQDFDATAIADVEGCVRQQFGQTDFGSRVKKGQSVAVAVGSRGINKLPALVRAVVESLKALDLKPFIIPAMGSHGRATAEGQARILEDMHVSEDSVGAPIISSMEVVSLGYVENGAEVFCARDAFEADHVVVINRVKPHTAFRGEVESGLCKMLAVGLGKQKGASLTHKFGLGRVIVPAARRLLEKINVLCGIAVVENPMDQIHTIQLALPESFVATDRRLLKLAWQMFPRIPLEDLDILIVDEMGKNISGAGMDPNIVGAWRRDGGARTPDYRTLIVLDLTDESHGNAVGIGLADLTTQYVMQKVDLKATYMNAITAGILRSSLMPIPLENDRVVLETALNLLADPRRVRMVRIANTLMIQNLWVTESCLPELRDKENLIVDDLPFRVEFDDQGRLKPFKT